MRHLLMIFVVVFLVLFSANAKANLIGVDFGPVGQTTPTNWTSVSGAGTFNNLGTETGQSTAVGLQVTGIAGGDPIPFAAGVNVGTIPSHSNSLANIGGNIFRFVQQQQVQLGLRIFNLEASRSYDLWVFGLSDGELGVNQAVSIQAGAITFNQAGLIQNLVANGTLGSSANDLSVYSVSATADGSGEINITVTSNPDLYAVAGLAIDVPVPPTFTKIFSPDTIAYGGTSTLTFTIDNSGSLADATSLDFTDNLPAGVTVADPANASTTCTGGTLTAVAGTGVISYTGGSLAAGSTCTLQADVTSTTAGTHNNTSGNLTSSLGNSGTASDSLTVGASVPPNFSKVFSPSAIAHGGTSTLTFTIDNSGSLADATSLDFTDNLPAGVTVADPANASTTCTGGTLTAVAGTSVISYTGGTVSASSACTVQADVTSSTSGNHNNTSRDLTSSAGNSGTAADTLVVNPPPPIPTLNEWAMILLSILLVVSGVIVLRKRRVSSNFAN
jgi:hypothetical protein